MGKGLALEFKHRFPEMYRTYVLMCEQEALRVGTVMFYSYKNNQENQIICNFPTKHGWWQPSTLVIIEKSLQAFIKYAPVWKIQSVAFPKVGCGLGGLNFELQVQPLLERYFSPTKFDVEIYR